MNTPPLNIQMHLFGKIVLKVGSLLLIHCFHIQSSSTAVTRSKKKGGKQSREVLTFIPINTSLRYCVSVYQSVMQEAHHQGQDSRRFSQLTGMSILARMTGSAFPHIEVEFCSLAKRIWALPCMHFFVCSCKLCVVLENSLHSRIK